MRILITGGCGFIGSHLTRHLFLSYPEYKIWNLDLLTYAGNPENLKDIEETERELPVEQKRYFFIRGDICDHELIAVLLEKEKFDAIINLAAETHVDRSIYESKSFIKTNVQGVHTLLDAVRKFKIPRFIHISTDEVYGDRHGENGAEENHAFSPSSPYSASKAAGDFLIQSYVRTFGLPAIILRPSNNFGTHQYPEKFIPLATSNMFEGKKIPIHGDGRQIRTWLYVKHTCEAIDILLHQGIIGEIYNIGGTEIENLEIVNTIAKILGKNSAEHIEFTKDRPGQDKKYSLNWNKFKKHYNWEPKGDFNDHMRKTVTWYIENPSWWRSIKESSAYQDHYARQKQGRWF